LLKLAQREGEITSISGSVEKSRILYRTALTLEAYIALLPVDCEAAVHRSSPYKRTEAQVASHLKLILCSQEGCWHNQNGNFFHEAFVVAGYSCCLHCFLGLRLIKSQNVCIRVATVYVCSLATCTSSPNFITNARFKTNERILHFS